MQELLMLSGNPSRRRKGKKRRSAAQRRATRKMLAALRRRGGGSKRRKSATIHVSANPAPKRRKYRRSMKVRARRAVRRAQAGFIRMGGMGSLSAPLSIVKTAAIGAVGAVGVNLVLSKLPLPPVLMTGKARFLTQGAVAIGVGMLAAKSKLVGANVAAKLAEGSLTVTLADAIREVAGDAGFNLSGMGYYLPAPRAVAPSASGAPSPQLGKYLTGPGAGGGSVSVLPVRRGMGNINSFRF